jgi:tetratricopeptide (TPR) repeat protein
MSKRHKCVRLWLRLCALGWLSVSLAAQTHWIRIRSASFEMYSDAGEKSSQDTLRYFEQVRSFFAQAMGGAPANPALPVRIVAFASKEEFEPYRINEFATSYYKGSSYEGTSGRDYIVMSETGAGAFPVIVHEYFHYFANHAHLNLPLWLNEGLAELYSTLKPVGDKIVVGALIPARYQALLRDPWVPLATILRVDRNSPYYNEKAKAGSLYNEGWALTHMLALTPEYRPKFPQLLLAIQNGTPSEQALTQVYGKLLASIEDDLQIYLEGKIFQGEEFAVTLAKPGGDLPVESVSAFDLNLMLADLIDRPGKEEEARKKLENLVREQPQRPEPYVALGSLAVRRGEPDEARKNFEKAFALGSRDPGMLWDLGRLAEQSDAPGSITAFNELLRQQPDRADVRSELAAVQLRVRAQSDSGNRVARAEKPASVQLEPPRNTTAPPAERLSMAGSFVQLDCGGMQAKLVLETTSGKKVFLVEDPSNVRVAGRSTETIDLSCGPQKPAGVRIDYDRPASGRPDIASRPDMEGVVRLIHFEP